MGLTTTHGCFDGAYSGFNMFRELVGKAAGLPHTPPGWPAGERSFLDIDWDSISLRQLEGHWDRKSPTVKAAGIYDPPITDPVLYLLVHYDCEGKLRRGYLPALKARLEEIEPAYDALIPRAPAGYARYASHLRQFIEGLGDAIEAGEHVAFH